MSESFVFFLMMVCMVIALSSSIAVVDCLVRREHRVALVGLPFALIGWSLGALAFLSLYGGK